MTVREQIVNQDIVLEEVKKLVAEAGANDVDRIYRPDLPHETDAIVVIFCWTEGQWSDPGKNQMETIRRSQNFLEAAGFKVEYTSWYSPRTGSDDPFGNVTGHSLKVRKS